MKEIDDLREEMAMFSKELSRMSKQMAQDGRIFRQINLEHHQKLMMLPYHQRDHPCTY